MPTIASCTIVGHLYKKPEPMKSGKGCRLSLWTQDSVKESADAERTKVFTSHQVVVFSQHEAEWLMRDGEKGTLVAVTGTFRVRTYEGKDGKTSAHTDIVAQSARILERKDGEAQAERPAPAATRAAASDDQEPPF